jgi:hypothetical protein
MAGPLNVPFASVQDIADVSAGLVDVAKTLAALSSSMDDPSLRETIEIQASRLLDFADRLSSAARTSYS